MASGAGVLVLVMSCGRGEYLRSTIEAFDDLVTGPVVHRVIHDDSGEPRFTAKLARTYGKRYKIITAGKVGETSGFAGAYRSAWGRIAGMGDYTHVFGLEDDFVFQRPVDLADVIGVLDANPHLAQMAWRRQAWYDGGEKAVGGWCELHAEEMTLRADGGHRWLEHDLLFTTNPSLYRRGVIKIGWPAGARSEDRFWLKLKSLGLPWGVHGADVRSAMWGDMTSGARWVEHIGYERPVGAHTY